MFASLNISTRHYLSHTHLRTAVMLANAATDIEALADGTFNQTSFNNQAISESYSLGAIISAVCFMEAAINEVLADSLKQPNTFKDQAIAERIALFQKHFQDSQSVSLPKKFEIVADCGRNPLATDKAPFQNALLLITLRNELVHFKPTDEVTHPDVSDGPKLKTKLRSKFELNKFSNSSTVFLLRCLGCGGARWAIETAYVLVTKVVGDAKLNRSSYKNIFDDLKGKSTNADKKQPRR